MASADAGKGGCRTLVGACIAIVGFMCLARFSSTAFQWWHREGYREVTAEVVSTPGGYRRWSSVRVPGILHPIQVENTALPSPQAKVYQAWYNPGAIWTFGIVLFDERLVAVDRAPTLPDRTSALSAVLLPLVAIVAGIWLIPRDIRRRIRKR